MFQFRCFICVFIVLCSQSIKAQYVEESTEKQDITPFKESFISFGIGISSPTGEYADNSDFSLKGGFAKNGYQTNLRYNRYMWKNLQIGILVGYAMSEYDDEYVENTLNESSVIGIWSVESGYYSTLALLAGPALSIPFENGYLDAHVMLGYSLCSKPPIEISYTDSTSFQYVKVEAASDVAVSMNVGVGLKLRMTDKIFMGFNVDVNLNYPQFNVLSSTNFGQHSAENYSLNMHMVNSGISLIYRYL